MANRIKPENHVLRYRVGAKTKAKLALLARADQMDLEPWLKRVLHMIANGQIKVPR